MVSRREWYERVNDAWPAQVPDLTAGEATVATRRLFKFVQKRPLALPIKITSGFRYTAVGLFGPYENRQRVLYVNPAPTWQGRLRHGGGWQALVHDLSHWLGGGHSKDHAHLELRMINQVVRRGWLDGRLKPKPRPEKPAVDSKVLAHRRVLERLARWTTKKRRADSAIAKLSRRLKYYERAGVAA